VRGFHGAGEIERVTVLGLVELVGESEPDQSWRTIRRQTGRVTQITLAGPAGTVTQTTALTPTQKAIYQAVAVPPQGAGKKVICLLRSVPREAADRPVCRTARRCRGRHTRRRRESAGPKPGQSAFLPEPCVPPPARVTAFDPR
jgi:hypothetical protein